MDFKISIKKIILQPYVWLPAILLFVVALYFPVASYGWITGMDQDLVIDNILIHTLSGRNLIDIFFTATAGRYQPISFLSYAIDISLFSGSSLHVIHLMNLILHLLNVILFFRLVQLLSDRTFIAVTASLLFALHPMNVESVAWISSRSFLLCTFFLLLATLSYVYAIKSPIKSQRHSNLSIGFFILALLSHPLAVIFPIAMILIDYHKGRNVKIARGNKILLLSFGLVFFIIAILSQEGMTTWQDITDKLLYAPYAVVLLLVKFFVPFGLSAHHPLPQEIPFMVAGMILLLLTIVFIVFWAYKKNKMIFSSLTFFLVAVLLTILLSYGMQGLYNEYMSYLAYMGLFIPFAYLLHYLFKYFSFRIKWISFIIIILFGAYVSSLAIISHNRIKVWENSEAVWTDVIEQYPDDDYAFFMRGDHWARNAQFNKAKFDYNQCIRRNPDAYMAINNIGLIYLEEGDLRLALAEFTKSIKVNDSFYKSYLNRGITYMRIGKNDLAMENMNRAIELNPNNALGYYNRGLVYERMNLLQDGIADFTKAIMLEPSRIIFYKDRGKAYAWMSNFKFAEMDYSKAIELDPTNAEMWFRRSLTRTSQDKFQEGLEDALMAQSLGFPVEEEYIKGLTVQALKGDLPLEE